MSNTIVVIEDDRDLLDMIQYILEEEGYRVVKYDRLERLGRIIEQQPNLVLLDVRLADGSGSKLCLSIKTNPLTQHIPVILVSAATGLEVIANRCRADAFIEKPFDLPYFTHVVNHYIKRTKR